MSRRTGTFKEFKDYTLAVARGERKVDPSEPKVWSEMTASEGDAEPNQLAPYAAGISPSFSVIPRRDDAFLHIYATNIAIIHGASILLAVSRALESLTQKIPMKPEYGNFLYEGNIQLIGCGISMLAIITWPAIEYFYFMILLRRRPTPLNTFVHYSLGVCQMISAYLVIFPRFFIWAIMLNAVFGMVAYGNDFWDTCYADNADIPQKLRNLVKRNIKKGIGLNAVSLLMVIILFYLVAFPGQDLVLPEFVNMNVAVVAMAAWLSVAVAMIGFFSDSVLKQAEQAWGERDFTQRTSAGGAEAGTSAQAPRAPRSSAKARPPRAKEHSSA